MKMIIKLKTKNIEIINDSNSLSKIIKYAL